MKKLILAIFTIAIVIFVFTNCNGPKEEVSQKEIVQQQDFEVYKNSKDVKIVYEPAITLKAGKPKVGKWTELTNVPNLFEGGNAGIIDGKIIAAMGYPSTTKTNIFDLDTKIWSMGAPAPGTSSEGASVTHGGKLYCVGGRNISNRLWAYDLADDAWTQLPSMSVARNGLAVAQVGDSIFAIGGRTGGSPLLGDALDVLEMYDIVGGTWTTMASLPTPRAECAAVAVGGKIYVIGGFDYTASPRVGIADVDVYDPNTDTWSSEPTDMPTPRGALYAIGTKGNEIYVIGGHDGIVWNTAPGGTGTIVEAYNVAKDTWKESSEFNYMPTARAEACVASYGGAIYMIGGAQPWNGSSIASVEMFVPNKK